MKTNLKIKKLNQIALIKTINDKWIPIKNGEEGIREVFCSLCTMNSDYSSCNSCIVKEKTGESSCVDTPYYIVKNLTCVFIEDNAYDLHAECTAAAQMEIDFLRSLIK